MRLFEIDEDKQKIITELKQNCSYIWDLYQRYESYIYHGNKKVKNAFSRHTSPVSRKPVDTPKEIQFVIDQYLKEEHGFKALRSNSVFGSNDPGQAKNYGDLFVMFPVDGFNFTWYREAFDFTAIWKEMYSGTEEENLIAEYYEDLDNEEYKGYAFEILDEVSAVIRPDDSNLDDFLETEEEREILINGEFYLLDEQLFKEIFNQE